jgi:hypothetical protein
VAILNEPVVRIISDRPELAEHRINELTGSYSPLVWSISPVGEGIVVTVVMIRTDQLPRQNIAVPVGLKIPGMRN